MLGHPDCHFPCPQDCGRYVELWNLVFMQFNRDEEGNMTSLPRPSIDTGAGLERLAAVLQGKISNFDTDLFRPLIEEAAGLANVEYGTSHDTDVSLRIIADHARAATFLISDGVLPSNEGRGYVLRLIMRRALYHGQTLGLNEAFLYRMAGHVVQMMKDAYPELVETAQHVAKAIKIEEERYAHTTRMGLEKLDDCEIVTPSGLISAFADVRRYLPKANREAVEVFFGKVPDSYPMWSVSGANPTPGARVWLMNQRNSLSGERKLNSAGDALLSSMKWGFGSIGLRRPREGTAWIAGEDLFALHDTFGLRPDFVRDVVTQVAVPAGHSLDIDIDGYNQGMQKQRERARASWKGVEKKTASPVFLKLAEDGKTVFDGYTRTTSADCRIMALAQKGEPVAEVKPGDEVEIVLDHTPFYAEAGGQVGDTGHFFAPATDHEVVHVLNTYYPVSGLIVHKAGAREGLRMGEVVTAVVDAERRDATRRNHTATHLLHAALRKTLGTHVKQAGSLVAPDRLRFDFTHYAALDEQDLLDIEDLVNEHILKNEVVATEEKDLDSAVACGAMALFGEKYADKVRVLSIDDFSKELCGGTHVGRTGDIGLFKIISEGSVAAGTRRIEAVTGEGVLKYLRQASETLALLADSLHAKPEELLQAVEKLTESEKKLRKEIASSRERDVAHQADAVVADWKEVKGVRVHLRKVDVADRALLRRAAEERLKKMGSGVVVLGAVLDGKVALVAVVSKDFTNKLDAGKIVKQAAAYVEGSGGGRKDLAEAGGKNPAKLDESLQAVPAIIEAML
jgi:alanyl-tRNA synthetase